ncbi:MAG TPA: hypothetical protein PLR07_09295 [Promineifilum sp.]|nr:hypothetical protein [Promineifilum sp.]HRO24475.1 hypothetical protein [Promineifilum sp.]
MKDDGRRTTDDGGKSTLFILKYERGASRGLSSVVSGQWSVN